MQTQCVVRNTILNVRQQIFVRRDSESGRSALPFNLKGPASVEIGKSGDWSFLGFNLTIAPDAGQMASDNQNDRGREQNDQNLSHVKHFFSVMMQRHRVLDSTKRGVGLLSS